MRPCSIVVFRRRRLVVVLALAVGALSVAAGGSPAAGWLAPTSTPPGSVEVDSQDMALDAQGDAVAVWTSYGVPWRVTQAATRPLGGAWSTPVTFSVPGEEGGWNPRVAVGADGDAVAVWSSVSHPSSSVTKQIVMAATRAAGGAWSAPVALSDADGIALTYEPRVVVDAQGDATVIWGEETEDAVVLRTRTRPHGGAWGAPVDLTDSGSVAGPQLAVDPQGDVTAIWSWRPVPEDTIAIIQSSTQLAGGTWSTPVDLSAGDRQALYPQVAVDAQGDAVAAWQSYPPDADGPVVQAARQTAGIGWGPAVDLSDGTAYQPDVAIDPQGTATAVWETHDDVGRIVHASTSTLGGTWSAAVDLSARDDANWIGAIPQVATDPQGDVTVIWKAFHSPSSNVAQAARREAGGSWSAPVDIGDTSGVIEPMRVAADPQGYVTAAWSYGSQLHSAVFDPIAPLLSDVTVPARGVVGQAVAMSVDPFDVWSSVSSRWDFGDGASGSGATVAHCYGSPGERTVTVTGTDAAGNATSASATLAIEPDPALAAGVDPCAAPAPEGGPGPGPGPSPGPSPAPGPGPPAGPSPPPGPGHGATAAAVSGLRQSSSRWRTRAVHRGPRLPVGTTFRFKLNRASSVRLEFSQVASGRRVAARCVKATKANRTKPRCSLYQSRGAVSLAGAAGSNAYAFRGKLRGRTLAPGRYRLRIAVLGGASPAATIDFTIAS